MVAILIASFNMLVISRATFAVCGYRARSVTNGWGKYWCLFDKSQFVWEMKIRTIDIIVICEDCESITTNRPVHLGHLNLGFKFVPKWELVDSDD
jgi:hypothetical protein